MRIGGIDGGTWASLISLQMMEVGSSQASRPSASDPSLQKAAWYQHESWGTDVSSFIFLILVEFAFYSLIKGVPALGIHANLTRNQHLPLQT